MCPFSAGRHLGYFHFWIIMYSGAMNIHHIQIFVWTYIFISLDNEIGIPRSETIGPNDNSLRQLYHFTIPPAMYESSNFSTSSLTLFMSMISNYPNVCKVVTHRYFDFHFSSNY